MGSESLHGGGCVNSGAERDGEHGVPRSAQSLPSQACIAMAPVGFLRPLSSHSPEEAHPSKHSGTLNESLLLPAKQEESSDSHPLLPSFSVSLMTDSSCPAVPLGSALFSLLTLPRASYLPCEVCHQR